MAEARARVHLCGDMRIELAGSVVDGAELGRQGRVLFAYLALNRSRSVTRQELLSAIWPDDPPAAAGAALRTLLSRLRRALGAPLIEGKSDLRLTLPEDAWLDVAAAESAAAEAKASAAEGRWTAVERPARVALQIAEGGLLTGCEATWIEERRRELEELRMVSLECLAQAGLALGEPLLTEGERAARTLIASAPYRETGYLFLMEALAAHGNVAEALRVYQDARTLLLEDLGAAPSAQLREAHAQLLRHGERHVAAPEGASSGASSSLLPPLPAPLSFLCAPERGPFAGREDELVRLQERLERVRDGRSEITLVVGEPGIGKTRLCAEFAHRARAQGARALYGRSDDEGIVPYQPFVEALRGYVSHCPTDQLERQLEGRASGLARLVPEIYQRLPGLPSATHSDSEGERYRLFDAVSGLLAEAAEPAGLVLILDDLHSADRQTLLLLKHLIRSHASSPLLLLGAYTGTDIGQPLAGTVADLRRDHLLERIPLEGLDTISVRELLDAQYPDPDDALTDAVGALSEGNPFFLQELLRHLIEKGLLDPGNRTWSLTGIDRVGIPEAVAEVVGQRFLRLGERTRGLLSTASAIGREFTLELLGAVSGVPDELLLEAVEEGVAAQILAEVPERPDRYSFSHALVRETLYEQLSGSRRVRLHRRIGEGLERVHASDPEAALPERAHHFLEAARGGDLERAIEYDARAGRRAMALLGYEEAARHFRRALTALELRQPPDDALRCELLLALGDAQLRTGHQVAANETFQRAAAAARELGAAEQLAQAALGFGGRFVYGETGRVEESLVALLEEAADGLGPGNEALLAVVLARLAAELYYAPDSGERRVEVSTEALRLARRGGNPRALGYVLGAVHFAIWRPENLSERLELADELLGIAEQIRDSDLATQANHWRLGDLMELGQIEEAERARKEHARLARELRLPLYLWEAASFRAMRALFVGRFEEAERLAGEAVGLSQELGDVYNAQQVFTAHLFLLRTEQNRLGELEPAVRELAAVRPDVIGWRCGLLFIDAQLGRELEARRELERLARGRFAEIPKDGFWLALLALLADVAARLEDASAAAELYELMLPFTGRTVVLGFPGLCYGAVDRFLGLLAATHGDVEAAHHHFQGALEMNERMGALPWLAHTRHDYARMLIAGGDPAERERAGALLATALDAARALGMVRLEDEAMAELELLEKATPQRLT